tara:strand:- start:49 stop:234 length:186 start_codon:yes stop_codon:yes gene_type:complete
LARQAGGTSRCAALASLAAASEAAADCGAEHLLFEKLDVRAGVCIVLAFESVHILLSRALL